MYFEKNVYMVYVFPLKILEAYHIASKLDIRVISSVSKIGKHFAKFVFYF